VTMHFWRWFRLFAGTAITLICLWLALRQVDLHDVTETVKRMRWSWLAVALVALTAGYTARIYRWWWMLRPCNPTLRLRACAWPLIAGFAINNVVPFRAGDALRVMGFRGQLGTPAVQILGSLLIERILDLTILLVILLVGVVGLRGAIPVLYLRTLVLVTGLGALGWTALLLMPDKLERILLRICRHSVLIARGWNPSAERHVRQLFVALHIVREPVCVIKLIALSAVVWTCEGGIFATVANGLHYNGQPYGPWFALATGSLSTLIPSSPGYVGTFDFFTISGMTAYGASASLAAATAFIVHAVLWLPLTTAGITYLLIINLGSHRGQLLERPTEGRERM
jgi:uncharacterized protein (TIRG00374 family)